jgi:diguanylate cyclase (GGDEF)-like protein
LEYCAPDVKQSEVVAIVKLIMTLQSIVTQRGPVSVTNAMAAPELARLHPEILALGIESVLAVPLTDGDEQVGILILEQCGAPRAWRDAETLVLKTIAEQIVLAVNNAKLRSLVKNLAVTEEKSGLLKRSSYLDFLVSEVKRSLPQCSPMTVMIMYFGKPSALVREVGEQAVNAAMSEIGQVICSQIRQNDVAVRYDFTSVALILADTCERNAFFVVDKLRKVLSGIRPPGRSQPLPMTVGIAEAVMHTDFDPTDIVTEVVNRAEAALNAAKSAGANKAHALAPTMETAARA